MNAKYVLKSVILSVLYIGTMFHCVLKIGRRACRSESRGDDVTTNKPRSIDKTIAHILQVSAAADEQVSPNEEYLRANYAPLSLGLWKRIETATPGPAF
jgi:hypothetical protein